MLNKNEQSKQSTRPNQARTSKPFLLGRSDRKWEDGGLSPNHSGGARKGENSYYVSSRNFLDASSDGSLYFSLWGSGGYPSFGLSNGEKYDEWRRVERGEAQVVVGARSAIFAPLKNLGAIIIDEEHEATYKQDSNPATMRVKWPCYELSFTRLFWSWGRRHLV